MKISSNYSITQLFVSKKITIVVDNQPLFINVPVLRDLYEDNK